jgi:hypothetical protein
MATCPWWIRWWHRRQRQADRAFIVPLLVGAARAETDAGAAFRIFIAQPGQEHWWCPCGEGERREVEEMLE